MELQYHRMNAQEFQDFQRLSTRHQSIAHRLNHLAKRAHDLTEEHKGRRPRTFYAIAPIVGWGARSASVIGLLISIAPLLGWDMKTLQTSVDTVWVHVTGQIPLLADVAGHLPGLAGADLSPIHLFAHTGGFAEKLASLASHTGGFA